MYSMAPTAVNGKFILAFFYSYVCASEDFNKRNASYGLARLTTRQTVSGHSW